MRWHNSLPWGQVSYWTISHLEFMHSQVSEARPGAPRLVQLQAVRYPGPKSAGRRLLAKNRVIHPSLRRPEAEEPKTAAGPSTGCVRCGSPIRGSTAIPSRSTAGRLQAILASLPLSSVSSFHLYRLATTLKTSTPARRGIHTRASPKNIPGIDSREQP